jgi:hypothetical protein
MPETMAINGAFDELIKRLDEAVQGYRELPQLYLVRDYVVWHKRRATAEEELCKLEELLSQVKQKSCGARDWCGRAIPC